MNKAKSRNLKASDLKACRICLATDVKLHSLQNSHLGTCMKSVAGFTNNCGGLPNYVCYQCAPILLKCGQLIAKSKTAQAALLDIFYKNGRITKGLLKGRNRSHMNLESSLSSFVLLNYDYIQYHSDDDAPEFIKTESVRDIKNETVKPEIKNIKVETVKQEIKVESPLEEVSHKAEFDNRIEEIKVENPVIEVTDEAEFDNSIAEMQVETPAIQVSDDVDILNEKLQKCNKRMSNSSQHPKIPNQPKQSEKKAQKRKLKENESISADKKRSKNTESVPVDNNWSKNPEVNKWSELKSMERDFKVFRIPYMERHTIWRSAQECIQTASELLCNVCGRSFLNVDLLQEHSHLHNPSIRGKIKCVVCLVYFSTNDALNYHVETIHGNRFYCKTCPMAFNNFEDAKCHRDLCMGAIARGGSVRCKRDLCMGVIVNRGNGFSLKRGKRAGKGRRRGPHPNLKLAKFKTRPTNPVSEAVVEASEGEKDCKVQKVGYFPNQLA